MNTGMNIEVDSCNDCPFAILVNELEREYKCFHPELVERIDTDIETRYYFTSTIPTLITPNWCPLKTQSITITLKDNNNAIYL